MILYDPERFHREEFLMTSEGLVVPMNFEEHGERSAGFTATSTPWEIDWGKIIIFLAIMQFVLSTILDR